MNKYDSVYLFVLVVPLRGLEAFAAGEKRLLLGRQDVDFVCNVQEQCNASEDWSSRTPPSCHCNFFQGDRQAYEVALNFVWKRKYEHDIVALRNSNIAALRSISGEATYVRGRDQKRQDLLCTSRSDVRISVKRSLSSAGRCSITVI